MSDYNPKKYDFDNFDDTKISGKHFAADNDYSDGFSNNFDDNDLNLTATEANDADTPTDDYGDDFYTDKDNFEAPDETKVFDPLKDDIYPYNSPKKDDDTNKKKNVVIMVLCITLAVVIFVFAMIMFIGDSDKKDNKKETEKETVATTVTQATEEETFFELETQADEEDEENDFDFDEPVQEPTDSQEQIQNETSAVTSAPTSAPTQIVTEAPTSAPTQEVTEAVQPDATDVPQDNIVE